MQRRSTPDRDPAKHAQHATQVEPGTHEGGGHAVIERIEHSESLPATIPATLAFESVLGPIVQRLPAEQAEELVERRLPIELAELLRRDADEALDEGSNGDLAAYVEEVAGRLEVDGDRARELVDVVIGSLRLLMSAEEVDAIANELTPQLASMWLRAADVPGAPRHSGSP